jgi:hypothetical protein
MMPKFYHIMIEYRKRKADGSGQTQQQNGAHSDGQRKPADEVLSLII